MAFSSTSVGTLRVCTFPEFRLFADPIGEGSFVQSDVACDLCGQMRGWKYAIEVDYDNPSLTVCPWCIKDGTAGARGYLFNDSEIYPAFQGVSQLTPDEAEEVERRTPGFVTWQGNRWQMCCGRACRYLGEADAEDLQGRWADAVGSLFEHDADWSEIAKSDLISNIRKANGPCAYIFQCVVCSKHRGYWDCH